MCCYRLRVLYDLSVVKLPIILVLPVENVSLSFELLFFPFNSLKRIFSKQKSSSVSNYHRWKIVSCEIFDLFHNFRGVDLSRSIPIKVLSVVFQNIFYDFFLFSIRKINRRYCSVYIL